MDELFRGTNLKDANGLHFINIGNAHQLEE